VPADPQDQLIIALDHPDLTGALRQVDQLAGLCCRYKVGLELFTRCGPAAVQAIVERGGRVFLDLKLHDIPETVARAVRAAAAPGVDLLTVHAAGGREMLQRAAAAAREAGGPRVLAVTVLTSLDLHDLAEVGVVAGDLADVVRRRAELARDAGVHGIVASPQEVRLLRAVLPADFLIVTPGVRAREQARSDQKRTGSAYQAIADGADLLVVGRPVRDAPDPRAAAAALLSEIRAGRAASAP
jgi:orotidine-5'-phosphate decarboxylase